MAGSLNKCMLIGNLGADPEIRNLQNGGKVASFRIATSETWRDKNTNERREKTEWHNVTVWNENLARVVEQYVRKGSKLYVEGQLQTRKYQDKSGSDRYTTEVVLQGFHGTLTLLDSRNGSDGGDERRPPPRQDSPRGQQQRPAQSRGDIDDDIPF